MKFNGNILFIFLPMFLGFFTQLFICKINKSSGSGVPFTPPYYVFGIAWFILYLLLGIAWYISLEKVDKTWDQKKRNSEKGKIYIWYGLLNIFLILWIVVYSCQNNKIGSLYILICCIALIINVYRVTHEGIKWLITPLIGWLCLATLMNAFEVNNSKK